MLLIRQLCCNNPRIASIHWLTSARQTKCHLGKLGSKWKGNHHSGWVWFSCQLPVNHAAMLSAALSSPQMKRTTMKVSSKLAVFTLGVSSLLSPWSVFRFPLRSKERLGNGTSQADSYWHWLLVVAVWCGRLGGGETWVGTHLVIAESVTQAQYWFA